MRHRITAGILALCCLGCGGYASNFVGSTMHQANSNLSFRYRATVSEEMTVVWIGPIAISDAGYSQLMLRLRAKADLKRNQMLANFREDVSFHTVLAASWKTTVVSADILEYQVPTNPSVSP